MAVKDLFPRYNEPRKCAALFCQNMPVSVHAGLELCHEHSLNAENNGYPWQSGINYTETATKKTHAI